MKWYRLNGRVLTLMLALCFFNFIFLGIEYQFDNMMALVTGPEQVVTAQGVYIGSQCAGISALSGGCFLHKRKILADCRIRRSTGRGNLCFVDLAAYLLWHDSGGGLHLFYSDWHGRKRSTLLSVQGGSSLNIWRRPSVYHMQLASFSSSLIIIL